MSRERIDIKFMASRTVMFRKNPITMLRRFAMTTREVPDNTGPLTQKRMETIDDGLYAHAAEFIDQAAKSKEPFFVWFNTTRMHIWTRLKSSSQGKTGIGLYADGMVEHDELLGNC